MRASTSDVRARTIDPSSRVFVLDTGRLPEETYAMMEIVYERYGIRVEAIAPSYLYRYRKGGQYAATPEGAF